MALFTQIMNYLFGPLDKKYCAYFFYMSVITFVLLLTVFFVELFVNKASFRPIILLMPFITYFQMRLFYSMCIKMS